MKNVRISEQQNKDAKTFKGLSLAGKTVSLLSLLFSVVCLSLAWSCGPFAYPSLHFNTYDSRLTPPVRWHQPVEDEMNRDTKQSSDQLEEAQLATKGTDRKGIKLYLKGRWLYRAGKLNEAKEIMESIYKSGSSSLLRARALYSLASIEYESNHFDLAAQTYQQVVRVFPKSDKREASLIMAARCLLRSPPQTDSFDWLDHPLPSPFAVQKGRAILWQLLEQYPQTHFRVNALGWLGRCDYIQKRYGRAFRFYLKQLSAASTMNEAWSALLSLRFTHRRMSVTDAREFNRFLRTEPSLVPSYLEYRLYYCQNDSRDFTNLSQLAEFFVKNCRPLPPSITVALADLEHRRHRYRSCLRWASRSLTAAKNRGIEDRADLAYYLRGAARYNMKNRRGAIADFTKLLRSFPKSPLTTTAQKNLALLYEEQGNLGRALDQYFELGYDADIAFFLDARMRTAEIEHYIAIRPHHPQHDLLIYSLGMRYLRADRLNRAERTLRRLSSKKLGDYSLGRDVPQWYSDHVKDKSLGKLHNPLVVVRDLRRLEAAILRTNWRNARAEALYTLASYYYSHRDLLFYNDALWKGSRSVDFGEFWNTGHSSRADDAAVHKHHYEHECLNRCREICLQIVRRYPHSPTAPKALYRAACCSRRLADFNNWWREENDRHNYWKEAIHLMKEVGHRYPNHPLAATARKYAQVFAGEIGE